ncbi:ABC transporter ATP-binding protein [Thauera sp. CAU 1555]|uniref:ABC transporter ATP-binding protein n=1 Tax=Thauera sedimentorum TaxID=2767595 RepID=A0ABR9BEP8_9RHOO|nr:ABC transporter ATP-binding protein [Thauera sedimentorum]MBC9072787.1 ABC transporter ATP-binding protein [Thauera sedimentorum]MBD8503706.1 ABC transporter ATP-binding protein [Thauera sedimentorum]
MRAEHVPPLLALAGVTVDHGALRAVHGIDLALHEGEVVSLIGANGAGKSTTLAAIAGVLPVADGEIRYAGEAIHLLPTHQRVRRGLALVPEGRGLFARLTVAENLRLGAYTRDNPQAVAEDLERVLALLPRIRERLHQQAGTLSGGEQQMLAIGRALLARPRLLLLDEPSMGLAPRLVDALFDTIATIAREGVSILLVEQNAALALELSQRAYVMANGLITLSGTAAELRDDPAVRHAYLGEV